MKQTITFLVMLLFITSCKQGSNDVSKGNDTAGVYAEQTNRANEKGQQSPYASYGAKISTENVLNSGEVTDKYAALKEGDTAIVKFEAPINSVCKSMGCWMRLDAGEEEVFVKFKDYGFFVPKDASGEAIVEGKAYLEEVTVDELQHMAEDAGKTKEEIAAITTPKRELRFMADGVLIKTK